ncbi:MAG: flagellar filament capping protein FliD [Treponema sp.]|jgi:flagellar hook-associated protein 2|nr:flagellar filament capping protein FliD [Treponema sp.]
MSDIYVPGVKSRFNTETLIEDLMKVERIPKERAQKQIETLKSEKGYWQEVGRRVTTLRESARSLYSFQNPFNERIARSSDESVLVATATRQAAEQERSFIVKQVARADRFLSDPLANSQRIEAGNYRFTIGSDEISFDYRGGSAKDFVETLNRRGKGKLGASLISVKPQTQSLLIESLVTGAENKLSFGGEAENLARATGMFKDTPAQAVDPAVAAAGVGRVEVNPSALSVAPGEKNSIPFPRTAELLSAGKNIQLSFETATGIRPDPPAPQKPEGPVLPAAGAITYGGITIENDQSALDIPEWTPPAARQRLDDMEMLSLRFSDGTGAKLPLVRDSEGFLQSAYTLSGFSPGKTVVSLEITNNNTNRDFTIRNVTVFDPDENKRNAPSNALSRAQDAVIEMEGIEISRPSNEISDLIPGLTVIAKSPSDREVRLSVEPDREAVKEAIISMVGNYNRLVAELNVLTRSDEKIIEELSYLSPEEQTQMRERLGTFSGDSTLNQFKNGLQRAVTNAYPTAMERELSMLAQIGIGTDVRHSGATAGYNASYLRGYLEIDEKILDAALETKLPAIQQLFGSDTDGDLISDTGVSVALEAMAKPYVESGGVVSLKTGTLDTRIGQEERRIVTLDRQLEAKEAALKRQYGQMEGAYSRMEKMGTSLEQFSQRANNNR